MGLGLRSLLRISFTDMSREIAGFLDFLSEEEALTHVFHMLIAVDHNSLFFCLTEDLLPRNTVLYGPPTNP